MLRCGTSLRVEVERIRSMLAHHSTPQRLPAKPSGLWRTPPYVYRSRVDAHVGILVSPASLGPRANPSTACLKICQPCCATGTGKLVVFQGESCVDFLKEWSCSGGCRFSAGTWNSWKQSNLLKKQVYFGVRAFIMSTRASRSGLGSSCAPSTLARYSHAARVEAQEALMDYLHYTRGLYYTDAEHISKNSPRFLKFLLTKVDNQEDVNHDIEKFLRYNPINEFEPFLESLGLKPSEIHVLLPRGLFFLSDDEELVENFRLLCNYGIPRSKIGKIYKEAYGVFRYDYGVLMSKLQAYEGLGLDTSTVIKLVSSCPSLLVGGINTDFVLVLEKLKGLGFGHYWIRACLSENYTYQWDKMLCVMDFFYEMGCIEEDMKQLIREHPWFLFNESGKQVYVVVSILLKLGMKMNKILSLLLRYPQIVSQTVVKNLCRSIRFLSESGMDPEDIARIVFKHPQSMGYLLDRKPEDVLSSLKIDKPKLCQIINEDPDQLGKLASKRKVKAMLPARDRTNLLEKTTFLLKLGFLENSDEMAAAQKQFRGRGDQLQERFDVLLNAGLNFPDAVHLVKEAPQILNQSVDVLEQKIDYLVNIAGYPLNSVKDFPTYLCYNVDRIKLRFSMFQWMKEKGIVKDKVAPSSIIACTKERFEKYYVNVLPEGPEVWETFNKSTST